MEGRLKPRERLQEKKRCLETGGERLEMRGTDKGEPHRHPESQGWKYRRGREGRGWGTDTQRKGTETQREWDRGPERGGRGPERGGMINREGAGRRSREGGRDPKRGKTQNPGQRT